VCAGGMSGVETAFAMLLEPAGRDGTGGDWVVRSDGNGERNAFARADTRRLARSLEMKCARANSLSLFLPLLLLCLPFSLSLSFSLSLAMPLFTSLVCLCPD